MAAIARARPRPSQTPSRGLVRAHILHLAAAGLWPIFILAAKSVRENVEVSALVDVLGAGR